MTLPAVFEKNSFLQTDNRKTSAGEIRIIKAFFLMMDIVILNISMTVMDI